MFKKLFTALVTTCVFASIVGCAQPKEEVDGAYDFIIYESDDDNTDLSDNPVVTKYHIEYKDCDNVADTLINKDSKYYFDESSDDYLVLEDGEYGLSYTEGYFKDYAECKDGAIDVSWSMTTVNGESASEGIGSTSLDGLEEYGFVINGWK